VRLRYAYFVKCVEVVKDAAGEVVELRCTYDPATLGGNAPDGRKVQATIHWVSAEHALEAEVRLYDRLFTVPNPSAEENWVAALNPASLEVLQGCQVEPSLAAAKPEERFQFERLGYFCVDAGQGGPSAAGPMEGAGAACDAAEGRPVFNRTVTLKDQWAKIEGKG
jgi:glutaminyl-tRNA synthetase